MSLDRIHTAGIVGAGTMGQGIAQVCALSGFQVLLHDIQEDFISKGINAIEKNLQTGIEKKKITVQQKQECLQKIKACTALTALKADLIIEAALENLDIKRKIFLQLEEVNAPECILTTNTSSIPVTQIGFVLKKPDRFAGLHFFNPANIMKLVEVVKGNQTSDEVAKTIYDLCLQMNKTPVMCKDAPGFIVNRVARHYYLEAMKLVENGIATFENVDEIMEAIGFKMGPFRLMDLIGMDVNLAVSQSLYDASNKAERFKPSPIQIDKVAKGELGKKTGKGFYNY